MGRLGEGREWVVEVDGTRITITHPDRVLFPADGITKRDLVAYYLDVAPLVLPLLRGRPLTLKPYPDGIDAPPYYLRSRPARAPAWLACTPYRVRTDGRTSCPIVATDARTLVWAANRSAIELHPWLSRVPDIERPDLLMFDLDPGPRLGLRDALRVAARLRGALERRGLTGFPKTSGKRGAHVLVPIEPGPTFDVVRAVCERIGKELRAELPHLVTLDYRVERRPDCVLVDYSQNSLAKSTVAPYSVRPVPGARVSTPLTWAEVEAGDVDPAAFSLRTLRARVEQVGDLTAELETARTRLDV